MPCAFLQLFTCMSILYAYCDSRNACGMGNALGYDGDGGDDDAPRGGGGYSPQMFVGMCRGKVKNGPGLRNELPVERENVGLRNELEPF